MITALNDLSVLQNHDGVGVPHCGEAVGDHEGSPFCHQTVHALLDVLFRSRIDGARRFIEDQDRCPGYRRSRDIKKLSLALAQVRAVALQNRVIAPGKPHDKGMGRCHLRRLNDLLVGGIKPSVADIFHDRSRKQMRILTHHGNVAAQLVPLNMADINAVDGDGPALDIVKTVDKVRDRSLSGSRGAHEGDLLSRLRVEADIL